MLQQVAPIWIRFTRLQQGIAIAFSLVLFIPYCQVYHYYSELDAKWFYNFIWSDIEVFASYLVLFLLWYLGTTSEKKWTKILARIGFTILGFLFSLLIWMVFVFPMQDFMVTMGILAVPILILVVLLDWIFAHPKNNLMSSVEVLDDLKEW